MTSALKQSPKHTPKAIPFTDTDLRDLLIGIEQDGSDTWLSPEHWDALMYRLIAAEKCLDACNECSPKHPCLYHEGTYQAWRKASGK